MLHREGQPNRKRKTGVAGFYPRDGGAAAVWARESAHRPPLCGAIDTNRGFAAQLCARLRARLRARLAAIAAKIGALSVVRGGDGRRRVRRLPRRFGGERPRLLSALRPSGTLAGVCRRCESLRRNSTRLSRRSITRFGARFNRRFQIREAMAFGRRARRFDGGIFSRRGGGSRRSPPRRARGVDSDSAASPARDDARV